MVKRWQKKVDKLDPKTKSNLYKIITDIIQGYFNMYQIEHVQGHKNLYRIRKGNIRVIFSKENNKGIIEHIDFRGDVYKKYS
ncbi:hypothetical protein MK079_03690 [Candidatus Gracilibacteria bacterium]|nr:hypothetical protein [Candidatus Gracilibacteria bacterium]